MLRSLTATMSPAKELTPSSSEKPTGPRRVRTGMALDSVNAQTWTDLAFRAEQTGPSGWAARQRCCQVQRSEPCLTKAEEEEVQQLFGKSEAKHKAKNRSDQEVPAQTARDINDKESAEEILNCGQSVLTGAV